MISFVIRTITNGHVKIFGKNFAPSEQFQKYDGRFDGGKYAFGLYYTCGKFEDFICLWGSEREYKNPECDDMKDTLVDGGFPWIWWYAK